MPATRRPQRRRGAAAVEFAIVAPLVLLLVFAQIIGGLGVFRYHELAHLARSCARYASTHGGNYQREGIASKTGVPAVSSSTDLADLLAREVASLDPSRIQVEVSWTAPANATPSNMPTYDNTDPYLPVPGQSVIQNNVIVRLSYQWTPEVFFIPSITLTSTSQMPMCY